MDSTNKQSNKFFSSSYEAPHWPPDEERARDEELETTDDCRGTSGQLQVLSGGDNDPSYYCFTIRHLKRGGTGAVRTWLAAEVLLEYLVLRGGLRNIQQKSVKIGGGKALNSLDFTLAPIRQTPLRHDKTATTTTPRKRHDIVELGAGSGFLGVGLSLSLNRGACNVYNNAPRTISNKKQKSYQPTVRIMCTDHDRATIKNMRHNIINQPRDKNISKAVRVELLEWGESIGGDKFSKAVRIMFRTESTADTNDDDNEDPIRLLTHLVASDVLYGESTLEPLSSIVAGAKLRNPAIVVVMLLRDRSPGSVAKLKSSIEEKVNEGLLRGAQTLDDIPTDDDENNGVPGGSSSLQGFSVSVRDVLHKDASNMKMVEC